MNDTSAPISTVTPLALLVRPRSEWPATLFDMLAIVVGSLLVALAAQVVIPLPAAISPVPITGQTLAVFFVGAMLGPARGAAALLMYLCEGAVGLPFFAGGASGVAAFLGPTGGYLIGFVVAAGLVGWLAERGWDRRPLTTVLAMLISSGVIYFYGAMWLAMFLGVKQAFVAGVLPFLPGDVVKCVVAASLLPGTWGVVRRLGGGVDR